MRRHVPAEGPGHPATAPSLCLPEQAAEPQSLARHQSMQAHPTTNIHHSILLFKFSDGSLRTRGRRAYKSRVDIA